MSQDIAFDIIARDRASATFSKVGRSAQQSSGKIEAFAKRGSKAAAAGFAIAGYAAVKFGVDSVKAASLAEQSIGGTEAVFGKYADTVIKQSNAAAKAYGLSANQFRESSNLIGALLKNQGVPMDKLAGKTKTLVALGSDLAATYGGTTKDAVQALGSALKGEFDPLEQFGVSLKQSTINTEAYRVANVKSKGAFDKLALSQQKSATQQATMNLLAKQSKDAQGQFAKQTDSLAEQQQILGARVENLQAKLGQKLLPVVSKFVGFLSDEGVPAVEKFIEEFEAGTGTAGEIRDALEDVYAVGKNVVSFFTSLPGPVKKFAVEGLIAYAVLTKLQSGFSSVATGGIGQFVTGMRNAETRMTTTRNTANQLGASLRNVAGVAGMVALTHATQQSSKELGVLEGAAGGAAAGFAIGGPWGAAIGAAGGGLLGIFTAGDKAAEAVRRGANAAKDAAPRYETFADALSQTGQAARDAFLEVTRLNLEKSGALTAARELGIDTATAVKAALGDAKAIAKINKRIGQEIKSGTLDSSSFKLLGSITANTKRLKADTVAANEALLARGKYNKVLKGVPKVVQTRIDALGLAATEQRIVGLTKKYNLTPKQINTILKATGVDKTKAEIEAIRKAAENAAKPRTLKFNIKVTGSTNANLADLGANGGPNGRMIGRGANAGQTYLQQLAASIAKGTPKVKVALDRVTAVIEAWKDKVASLKERRAEFTSTFGSDSIFGADIETTGKSLSGLLQFQTQQAQKAAQLFQDIQAVTSKGLSKGLVAQLQAAGSSGAAQLRLLAGASADQIAQFNALNAQTASSNSASGLLAGNYVTGRDVDRDIATAQMRQAVAQAVKEGLQGLKLETKVRGSDIIVSVRATNNNRGRPPGDFSR